MTKRSRGKFSGDGNGQRPTRLKSWQAGARPFEPAPPVLRMNRAVARFTSSAPNLILASMAVPARARRTVPLLQERSSRRDAGATINLICGLAGSLSAGLEEFFYLLDVGGDVNAYGAIHCFDYVDMEAVF